MSVCVDCNVKDSCKSYGRKTRYDKTKMIKINLESNNVCNEKKSNQGSNYETYKNEPINNKRDSDDESIS